MKTYKVKEQNIIPWLKEHVIDCLLNHKDSNNFSKPHPNELHHFMRPSLHCKDKIRGVDEGDQVQFELPDSTSGTKKDFVVLYTYTVAKYDDFSLILTRDEPNVMEAPHDPLPSI